MIRKVAENIWVQEQSQKYYGLEVGTRMTIICLADSQLLVISPIKTDAKNIEQINQLGKVTWIVAPNLYHHLYVADFQDAYPQAKLLVAPGLELKRKDLVVDQVLAQDLIKFDNELEYCLFAGFKILDIPKISPLNEVVFFHIKSKTLILTDTAFHFDNSFPLTTQLATRILGGYLTLSPTILEKLAIDNKTQLKQSIKTILNWDFERVIMAHGTIVEREGKQKLVQGYQQFLGEKLSFT
jgi:hypothetical protein